MGVQRQEDASTPLVDGRRRLEPMQLAPMLFVWGVIGALYGIYVLHHCLPLLQLDLLRSERDEPRHALGRRHLAALHALTAMLAVCYFRSVRTSPGEIPRGDARWQYMTNEDAGAKAISTETKKSGDRRHCKWCGLYKPDRCHHCRVCRTCVLKMDHHCPWIYNCVGFHNYKFFFLLLFYTVATLIFIATTMLSSVSQGMQDHTPFATMFFLLWGYSLTLFLLFFVGLFFVFHCWLLSINMTTIEFCEKTAEKDSQSRYNQGLVRNMRGALGEDLWLALLPTTPRLGTGVDFIERVQGIERQEAPPAPEVLEAAPFHQPRRLGGARGTVAGGTYYGSTEEAFATPAPSSASMNLASQQSLDRESLLPASQLSVPH